MDLETRTPYQLGEAVIATPDARVVIQEPDGPAQGMNLQQLFGRFLMVDVAHETRAALFADLAHAANSIGLVYADPTPGRSGYYLKSGASGVGAWTLTRLTKGDPGAPGSGDNVTASVEALAAIDTAAEDSASIVYVQEFDASYAFDGASAAAADGWVVIEPDVGAGRWLLQSKGLTVPPIGGGADDKARLAAAATALAAAGKIMRLGPETYNLDDTWEMPLGGLLFEGTPQTVIDVTLTPDGQPTTAALYAGPGAVAASTTVAAANVVSGRVISSTASVAAGKFVRIINDDSGDGKHGSLYKVKSVSGAGPYALTLDRDIRTQFGIGDSIDVFNAVPNGHRIHGNGMTVRGTATRLFEFICTWGCYVDGVIFEPIGLDSVTGSFDLFGYNNHFGPAVEVDGTGGCVGGLILESQEGSTCAAIVRNCVDAGVMLQDCIDCHDDSTVTGCDYGLVLSGDGNTNGCLDCFGTGTYNANAIQGIAVIEGSRGTRILNATAKFSPTNLSIGDGSGGNVSGTVASGDFSAGTTAGISVNPSAFGTGFGIVETTDSTTGIATQAPISVLHHIHRGAIGALANVLLNDGGVAHVALCDYNVTPGNVVLVKTISDGVTTYGAGEVIGGADAILFFTDNTARIELDAITGAAAGASFGAYANGAGSTIQLSPKTSLVGCGVPTGGAGTILVPRKGLSKSIGAAGTTAVTAEETLKTYSVPANTLRPGQKIVARAWGTGANNGNTKTLRLRVGGTVVSTAALPTGAAVDWTIELELHCTGIDAQEYRTLLVANGVPAPASGALALDDGAAIAVELSGQNGTASANDIVARGLEVTHTNA